MTHNREKKSESIPELHTFRGRSEAERLFKSIGFSANVVESSYLSSLFIFLSNIDGIKKILDTNSKFLFPLAFAFKALDLVLYGAEYLSGTNKNAETTGELILKIIVTTLVGLAVFGATIIAAHFIPIIFAIAMGVDCLVSFGKFIWCSQKADKAMNKKKTNEQGEEINAPDRVAAQYYDNKAHDYLIRAGIGLVCCVAVVVTLILLPVATTIAAAAIGIVAGLSVLGGLGFGIYKMAKYLSAKKAAESPIEKENVNAEDLSEDKPSFTHINKLDLLAKKDDTEKNVQTAELAKLEEIKKKEQALNECKKKKSFFSSKTAEMQKLEKEITDLKTELNEIRPKPTHDLLNDTGFFHHSIELLRPIADSGHYEALEKLHEMIAYHKNMIQQQVHKNLTTEGHSKLFDTEYNKRQQKLLALDFLDEFVKYFGHVELENNLEKRIKIGNFDRTFHSKQELIVMVDKHVSETYKGVFQSFYKETGTVEALFKYSYKILMYDQRELHKQAMLAEERNEQLRD